MESRQVTLTVTNGVYVIGDVVGGALTFADMTVYPGRPGIIAIRSIKFAAVAVIAYELWFFNANLVTPIVDADPFAIVVADEPKILGVVPIAAADYCAAQSAFSVATVRNVNLMCELTTGDLICYLKATAVTSPGTTVAYLTLDYEVLPSPEV